MYIPRKNSVTPLFILFKICGSVRLCTLFVILYKLPEGGCTPLPHLANVVKINRGFVRTELFVAYSQSSTWDSISDAAADWRYLFEKGPDCSAD